MRCAMMHALLLQRSGRPAVPVSACHVGAGNGDLGQLGINAYGSARIPVAVIAPAGVTAWKQVSSGWSHTCGLASNGLLWCWGACPVEGLWRSSALSVSWEHAWLDGRLQPGCQGCRNCRHTLQSCLLLTVCASCHAGMNDNGRLGINSTSVRTALTPAAVWAPPGVTAWAQVSVGEAQTCALAGTDGSAWCWGAYLAKGL